MSADNVDNIIETKALYKIYTRGNTSVNAVDNVDLTIKKGEFSALCGPSGSGKTTLLNLISALDSPTDGEVWFEGQLLSGLSRTQLSRLRRDRIGFVFQSFNLVPVLSAFENVELVLSLQGVPSKTRHDIVMPLLSSLGLEGLEHAKPAALSGGQQQRVAVARAIAHKPAIVMADEPTANLDSKSAGNLLDYMEKLNAEQNITFLFSTHDQKVMDRARRVITLVDGKISDDVYQNSEGASKNSNF